VVTFAGKFFGGFDGSYVCAEAVVKGDEATKMGVSYEDWRW
jgi:hypothetical protein